MSNEARPNGAIYGTAIAQDGGSAKRISLTAMPLWVSRSLTLLPRTRTNVNSEYRF